MKFDIKINRSKAPSHVHEVQRHTWRNYRRLRLIGFVALLAAFIFGTHWVIVSSRLMRFESMKIVGTEHLQEEDVRVFLEHRIPDVSWPKSLLGYSHFWVWPSVWTKEELRDLPHLKTIRFEPNYKERHLLVKVQERDFLGVWCNNANGGTDCVWFDEEGIAFEPSLKPDGYLIFNILDQSSTTRVLGDKVISSEQFKNINTLEEVLSESKESYRRYNLTAERDELSVQLKNGPLLRFSINFPSRYVADVLKSLRRREIFSQLSYVDFRTQNKVFYK